MNRKRSFLPYLLSSAALAIMLSSQAPAATPETPGHSGEGPVARFKRLIKSSPESLRIDFYMPANERRIKGISSVVLVTPGTLLESGSIRLFWDGASACSADSQVDGKTLLKLVDFFEQKGLLKTASFTCSEAVSKPAEAAPFKRISGPEKGEIRIYCQSGQWWIYANLDPDDKQIVELYRQSAKQLPPETEKQMNQLAENTAKLSIPDGAEPFNRLLDVLVYELFNR